MFLYGHVCASCGNIRNISQTFLPADLMLSRLHQEDLLSLTALLSCYTHPNANICSKLSESLRKDKETLQGRVSYIYLKKAPL